MQKERLATATAKLADLAVGGGDSSEVAAAATAMWQSIHADLSKIIGPKGMCALYQRSLYLEHANFPWLDALQDTALHPGQFDGLREALSQQPVAVGVAANRALLETFCGLLSHLIGESLAARLLGAVWTNTASGPAV